jgi:polyphosphate glucokinase
VAKTVATLVKRFGWQGPVGCGFPGVIRDGVVLTAANISSKWLGVDAAQLFGDATGCDFTVANDADVAGIAEMRFGAGRGRNGVVMVMTLGTGIGSAFFVNGVLFPNTELGHLEIDGRQAEKWASDKVREDEGLSWKKWASRVDVYMKRVHAYLWPDLFIIGGGGSKKIDKFMKHLKVDAEVVAAQLRNQAGIVGAAVLAAEARRG